MRLWVRGFSVTMLDFEVLLVLMGAVADLAKAMDEDSPRQAIARFALVEFPAGLTAQFRIPQPVEGEQRAFQPPQLAQRRSAAARPVADFLEPNARVRARRLQKFAAIYGWFTEGFDTPDLREAKALLDGLGGA